MPSSPHVRIKGHHRLPEGAGLADGGLHDDIGVQGAAWTAVR